MTDFADDGSWKKDAPCKGLTDLFYAQGEQGKGPADYRPAQSICRECPLIAECRKWAEHYGDIVGGEAQHGVVAGLAPKTRWSRGRPITAMPCAVCSSWYWPLQGPQRTCGPECRDLWRVATRKRDDKQRAARRIRKESA